MSFESPRDRGSPRSPLGNKNDLLLNSKKDSQANSHARIVKSNVGE